MDLNIPVYLNSEELERLRELKKAYSEALSLLEQYIEEMIVALSTPITYEVGTLDSPVLKEIFSNFHETYAYMEERDALTKAGISSCKKIHDSKPFPRNTLYHRKWQYRGAGGFRFRQNIRGYGGGASGKDKGHEAPCQ